VGAVVGGSERSRCGRVLCADMRNDISRHPFVFQLVSAALLNRYNIVQKAWVRRRLRLASLVPSPSVLR
jgi:hypothetical protein